MRLLVLCLFAAALGPGCADGETVRRLTLVAIGDPVTVAATPASGAAGIALGRLTGGDELALVWSDAVDDGTNEHIVARRFDENLNAIGAEVELREPTSNLLRPVTVCGEADVGRNAFVAAWGEKVSLLNLPDGVTLDLGNVRAARASGEPPAAQAVFEVNDDTIGSQSDPEVACLAGGGFVVAWTSVCEAVERRSGNVLRFFRPAECDEQPADGIYFRRFDVDGQPLGSAVRIETEPGARPGSPSVASFGDNRFLIAAPVSGTTGGLVRIERYDDEGSLVEQVEVEAGGAFLRPRMSCSRGGSRCVAVWEEEGGVIALVIAPTSLQRSSRVRIVENEDSTVATDPDVACDPTSRCLVTWLLVREEVVDDVVFSEPIGRFGRVLNARTRGLGGTEEIDRATEALELDGPVVVSLATSRYVAASADNDAISLQRFSLRTE